MATKNSKNARLLISTTLASPYTVVTKSHGLKLGLGADWSEDTGHGASFKGYTKGLMDFNATVAQYYDTAFPLLSGASINGTSYYFLAYFDYPTDTTSYWRGQCTFALNEHNLDIGTTIDQTFEMRIYNGDVVLVLNSTSYS